MQKIHSINSATVNSDTSTTSDLIASVVSGQKLNRNGNDATANGKHSFVKNKTNSNNHNHNNLKISAEITKATKPKASAPPPPPTKPIPLSGGATSSGLMSADIVNLANVLSAQTTSIASDAQAKQVLKEAVDAVVNSFAKHTQGYGRGEQHFFFPLPPFYRGSYSISVISRTHQVRRHYWFSAILCERTAAHRIENPYHCDHTAGNKEMNIIRAITDIANFLCVRWHVHLHHRSAALMTSSLRRTGECECVCGRTRCLLHYNEFRMGNRDYPRRNIGKLLSFTERRYTRETRDHSNNKITHVQDNGHGNGNGNGSS